MHCKCVYVPCMYLNAVMLKSHQQIQLEQTNAHEKVRQSAGHKEHTFKSSTAHRSKKAPFCPQKKKTFIKLELKQEQQSAEQASNNYMLTIKQLIFGGKRGFKSVAPELVYLPAQFITSLYKEHLTTAMAQPPV